jgi:hypothetical protein
MTKQKKVYKKGATIAEIEAQLVGFNLFGDGDAIVADIPATNPRPQVPPKTVRLSWDPADEIDTGAAWDALLSHV